MTCMYQAMVHFKLNPRISAERTHFGIKKFSLFSHKRRPAQRSHERFKPKLIDKLSDSLESKVVCGVTRQSHHLSLVHDKSRGSSKVDTPTALGSAMQPDAVLGIFPWHHSIWALHCHLKSMRQTETIWRGWEMDSMSAWCLCLVFGYKVMLKYLFGLQAKANIAPKTALM